jgi:hypothetical protein
MLEKKTKILLLSMRSCTLSFLLLLLSVFLSSPLRANPLLPPPFELLVSELMFDSEGKWVMELRPSYTDHGYYTEMVDSICIKSSNSRVKWNGLLTGEDGFYVSPEIILLRNDSLDSDFIINPEGDYIQVTTYYKWEPDSISYTLIFGSYPGATVRKPNEGESIVWAEGYYCIDVTPTIDFPNDNEGMFANVTFNIYYPDKQPFYYPDVRLFDANHSQLIPIYKNEDGSYSGNLYYCRYLIDKLYIGNAYGQYYDYWEFKSPVNCWMDDAIDLGNGAKIRIDLDRFTDIQTVKKKEVLKIIPNPVTENAFFYETTLPVRSAKSAIEIIGLNGQILAQYPVFENKGKIILPSNIVKGIYNAVLRVNEKRYATAKIIVQ